MFGMEQPQTGVSEAHGCELSSGNVSVSKLNDICENVDLPVPGESEEKHTAAIDVRSDVGTWGVFY